MSRNGPTAEERKAALLEALPFVKVGWETFLARFHELAEKEVLPHRHNTSLQSLRTYASSQRLWLVLKLYYGLTPMGVKTTNEIAEMFEVSDARINQMRRKALRRLKHPSRSRRFIND